MNEAENSLDGSLLEESMMSYMGRDIFNLFHLSYTEYMDLTVDVVILMNRIADKELDKRLKLKESINKDIEKGK